jgi:hypothetical protein
MSDSTDDAAYEKNVKEQYEVLGRFIEAFELMVSEVRNICIMLLAHDGNNGDLLAIAFHHQALTAKPLFDIMRAIIADLVTKTSHRAYPHRDFYRTLLRHVQKQYDYLVNMRNDLLHGTWYIGIGRSGLDPDHVEFHLEKYTTTKDGLKRMLELPRTANELKELTKLCDETLAWIENIGASLDPIRNVEIKELFAYRDSKLQLVDDRADLLPGIPSS